MVQVHRSCCAHTVHADSPGIQLVVVVQLVLSCSMHCSLHHPSGFISHLSGCHCCRSGVSWPFILTWLNHLNIAATPIVSTAYLAPSTTSWQYRTFSMCPDSTCSPLDSSPPKRALWLRIMMTGSVGFLDISS